MDQALFHRIGPEGLLLEERLLGALCRTLGYAGLARKSDHRARVLMGICRLVGVVPGSLQPDAPASNDPRRFLFGMLLRQAERFRGVQEGEYEPLFRQLAESVEADLLALAERIALA